MAADEEENYVVAQANTPLNDDGTIRSERTLVRRSPQAASLEDLRKMLEAESFFGATTDIGYVPPNEVDFIDVSPKQIVCRSVPRSIPFLEHDDANRALMGANMQKQAVPLLRAEAPYIGTGIENRAARDAADLIQATDDGEVTEVSGDMITVQYKTEGKRVYRLAKFRRSNQDTCDHHVPASSRATRSALARSSPTVRRPTRANSPSARTSSWRSCRGRATTSRTPSSSPSAW